MERRNLEQWIAASILICLSSLAQAGEFSSTKYAVYKGDVNSDGYEDIYLARKDDIVIIAHTPAIPIAIPVDESYVLHGQADGFYGVPTLNNSINTGGLTQQTNGVSFADFNNDGFDDIVIQGEQTGDNSVLLTGTSAGTTPAVLQQFSTIHGMDVSLANADISMEDVNGDGYADFVIVWTSGGSTSLANLASGQFALEGPNAPPEAQIASAPAPDSISDAVGVTAGSFRVDESGGATYSVPILTAPGIAGVAPQMSLNYSSQSGPGIAGMGWSIGGMSAITRCRQTIETDNNNDGIHLDARDRYCMDGHRLVEVASSTNNIEYRTEVDQFAKIIGYEAATGDPTHFVVWRKDGSVSEYGNTSDSRMEATGTTKGFVWAQNEFADNVGNAITFEYSEDTVNGSQLIDRVEYAGGDAEISFNYEALPSGASPKTSFVAGSKFTSDKRLASIESRNNLAELRTYRLTYDESTLTNRSRLKEIEECNGAICYAPTTFNWAETNIGVDYNGISNTTGGVGGMQLADLNGDGVNEVMYLSIVDQGNDVDFYVRVMRYNSVNGRYEQGDFGLAPGNSSPAGIYIDDDHLGTWTIIDYNNDGKHDLMYVGSDILMVRLGEDYNGQGDLGGTVYTIDSGYDTGTLTVADYDGDGLPDILDGGPNTVRLLKENPSGTPTLPYHYEPSIQMTGLPGCYAEFFTAARCNTGFYSISTQGATPVIADFNADGVVDLFRKELYIDVFSAEAGQTPEPDRTVWTLYASKSGSEDYEIYHAFVDLSWAHTELDFKFGDFNGDGLTDIAYRSSDYSGGQAYWSYQLNNGDGFETAVSLGLYGLAEAKQFRFLDYNGDGAADMFYISTGSTTWGVREWNGGGFDAGLTTTINAKPGSGADLDEFATAFFDANGDGKLDAINAKAVDDTPRDVRTYIGRDAFQPNDMIDEITNGFGAKTHVVYNAISDPAHATLYTRGTDANTLVFGQGSPVFDLQHPMYVARQVQSSAPAAGSTPGSVNHNATSSISYRYGEFKIQSGGRGSLGFGFVVSVDDQTGYETTTHYMQGFPFVGRPESTETTDGNDRISIAINTWDDNNWNGPNRQPFLNVAVEQSHSADTTDATTGSYTVGGILATTTTTTTMHPQYGDYGDVGTIVTETVAQGYSYTKTTSNTYHAPDTTLWHTGRLDTTTVVHDRTDNTNGTVTRTSRFEYDTVTGLLKKEVVEPGSAQEITLTTEYVHDSYGNVVQTTQDGYRGFQLPGETDPTVVDRTAKTFFDVDGRYSTYTENHYGHQQTVISRNAYGAVTEAEDAIGNRARTVYGAMGRQYWSGDDVGGFSQTVHRDCITVNCPTGATYRLQTLSAGGGESMAYYDVLGREVRAAARMFDGNWTISVQEYDALGRVVHTSEPFSASTPEGGTPVYWTVVVYDDLGRPTRTTHPDGSFSTALYDGFDVLNADPNGKTRKEFKNALGELVRAEDHLTGWVTYGYDEQGNLATSTAGGSGVASVTSTISYDLLGRKTSMTDANMGSWAYEYNAFGELIKQTTGTGDSTEMSYDRLGRMVRRIDYEGATLEVADAAWVYDTAPLDGGGVALGQLHIEDTEVSGSTPISRIYTYDEFGRSESVTTTILDGGGSESYMARTTYDEFGRVFQSFDGAQAFSGLEYTYNAYGFVERVDEAATSGSVTQTYYSVGAMDARGNVTVLNKGPLTVTRTFDPATGRATEIYAQNALAQTVQNLDLDWDAVGNLLEKHDQNRTESGSYKNILELYEYDDLYRLKTVTQGSIDTLDMAYDALGNITQKNAYTSTGTTDSNATVSGYGYTAGTHRLSAANGSSYVYDGNGSVTSGGGRSITWGVHNKPTSITKGLRTVHISYGPNRSRYKRVDDFGQSSETVTHYAGGVEKIWRPGGVVETKRYLAGEAIITHKNDNGSITETLRWLLTDHLGSTDLLVDQVGEVEQAMSFDAFGSRRSAFDFASYSATNIANFDIGITTRGYTGHEGLDGVGLIHMNGRVYDPGIGRFISADPFVQAPNNTQSLNRYAYVWNNPLSYNDPSGHFVFTIGAAVWLASLETAAAWYVAGAVMGAAGFLDALAQGASFQDALKGGVIAGVTAGAFSALGAANLNFIGGNELVTQTLVFGTMGGISNVLQGGKFGHGFLSAGLSGVVSGGLASALKPALGAKAGEVFAMMIVGGTMSDATGGKFANGAAYAAFSMAVEGVVHNDSVGITGAAGDSLAGIDVSDPRVARPEIDFSQEFSSPGEAKQALEVSMEEARLAGNPDWEYGGITVQVGSLSPTNSVYYNSNIVTSKSSTGIAWHMPTLYGISRHTPIVALHHYHPLVSVRQGARTVSGTPRSFSPQDRTMFNKLLQNHRNPEQRIPGFFHGVYMYDKHGTRRYAGGRLSGIPCTKGIASC